MFNLNISNLKTKGTFLYKIDRSFALYIFGIIQYIITIFHRYKWCVSINSKHKDFWWIFHLELYHKKKKPFCVKMKYLDTLMIVKMLSNSCSFTQSIINQSINQYLCFNSSRLCSESKQNPHLLVTHFTYSDYYYILLYILKS